MKTKSKFKSFLSVLLALTMLLSTFPMITHAAQSNEYVDPADSWISSNNRTNELDVNSTTTYETQYCYICAKQTMVITYRVPEYTKSGETALNRGVMFSDGTLIDGRGKGNLDDGTPGVDAYYTGYHWTKAVCQNCGTINTVNGPDYYAFNNNVYGLYSCDHNFFMDFDSSTYVPYNEDTHLTTLKRGEYCKFCKGTFARAAIGLEDHDFSESVDAQIGNNRFYISETCDTCEYETSEYVTAKAVVTSYYGVEDGESHTLTVDDLSDRGVKTSIRYGTSADNCNKTTAPSYVQPGYNAVYYQIEYSYAGESMTENGVSYVWILAEDEPEEDKNGTVIVLPQTHEHEFHYLETVKPSCEELGYDRFQCNGCGELEKRNYIPATGHDYDEIEIREATCKQGGLVLTLCRDCGDYYQETTALGEHKYHTEHKNPTCRIVGYDEHTCEVCGDSYITNMTPIINHSYERVTKAPDCINKGYSTYTCTMCGSNYVDDYVDALGHDWDEGHTVTSSGCTTEGVIEYNCQFDGCTATMVQATDATGHTPGDEATCTEPQICEVCETVLVLPLGHTHSEEVIEPTCTAMGYTIFTCECGDTYTGDYTDIIDHDYAEEVTEPTCTEHGFTTYTCECGHSYVSDYVDAIPHDYTGVVTEPTCTSMGFTTYTCEDCGNSYVGDYVDMTEHNYSKETVEPTCTEHGYAVYTCPDCGKSYIGDYKDSLEHTYTETVIAPTCTEMGYTIFKCNDCDDEYKGDYTDKLPHDYDKAVTEPTCTEFGYTTYSCKNCDDEYVADYTDKLAHKYETVVTAPTCLTMGYTTYTCKCGDTYKADYKEPLGHTPSDWIIDTPATIQNAGAKHIECLTCGIVLQSADIAQLVDEDRTDEDGEASVGSYSIILTDSKNIPIFNSDITIDVNDNVTIKLPAGRLLDYEDQTTITVFHTETQEAVTDLQIFIYDASNNAATGATDANGQLKVPNNQSSTGDDNGTIGKDENEDKFTFVVRVSDKENVVIPDCDIYIGESNNIVVDLPEGVKPSVEAPVIVTVEDQYGNPQKNVTIIALGDNDYIEKGKTDIYGRVTLPMVSEGFTNNQGHVTVDNINVIVSDEIGLIENAFVKHNEDGTISVDLPEGKAISHANRTTITVLDSEGLAIAGKTITVTDLEEKTYTAATDEAGKIVVPPLSEDYSDETGMAVVNGYTVLITDETKPIENAFVEMIDGVISVILPDGVVFDYHNRITAEIKDTEGNPGVGITVNFTDGNKNNESVVSDENGKAIVPPVHKDMTDVEGKAKVNGYNVVITDETKPIANAFIEMVDGKISVKLPEGVTFDYHNRITAVVTDSEDKPVKDMSVTFTDMENKSETNLTDENGKAVVPPANIDYTDINGFAQVDGYSVTIKDENGFVEKAFVTHTDDDKLDIKLPDNLLIQYSNRITVQVTDRETQAPVKDLAVTINEVLVPTESEGETQNPDSSENNPDAPGAGTSNENESDKTAPEAKTMTGTTDAKGVVVFPPLNEDITDNEGNSGIEETKPGAGEDTDGDGKEDKPGADVTTTYKVLVNDTKGVIGDALVKIEDGKVTVTLPDGKTLTTSNQTTVTVKDNEDKAVKGVSVTIKDKTTSKSGTTDANGKVTLPVKSSGGGGGGGSYSGGGGGGGSYSSTTIKVVDKDGKTVSVSRSTATNKATLTLPAGKNLLKDDNYYEITVTSGSKAKADYTIVLKDRNGNEVTGVTDDDGKITLPGVEHKSYIFGYPDGTFRPNGNMTRSEAAAIFARLIAEAKGETISGKSSFKDVASGEWYASYVAYLEKYDVIKGYADNTFRADNQVTRAEFVAMSVRYYDLFGDLPTVSNTKKYSDVSSNYWAVKEISVAKEIGWLNGYADGTFRGDNEITRAEAVTVINRATGRTPDKEHINENYTKLNRFTDVTDNNAWFFYDCMEACNTHLGATTSDGENWID